VTYIAPAFSAYISCSFITGSAIVNRNNSHRAVFVRTAGHCHLSGHAEKLVGDSGEHAASRG